VRVVANCHPLSFSKKGGGVGRIEFYHINGTMRQPAIIIKLKPLDILPGKEPTQELPAALTTVLLEPVVLGAMVVGVVIPEVVVAEVIVVEVDFLEAVTELKYWGELESERAVAKGSSD
jgi:hypothetical protein